MDHPWSFAILHHFPLLTDMIKFMSFIHAYPDNLRFKKDHAGTPKGNAQIVSFNCNSLLFFVHFRRNKTDSHRRFNFDTSPCQDSDLSCTG